MTRILLQNVSVFDGRTLRQPSQVLFQASPGNILHIDLADLEEADLVVDGSGCTLVSAFIDAKIDAGAAGAALEQFASFGIGTVIDLSSSSSEAQAMRHASSLDESLPDYYSSGTTAVAMDAEVRVGFPIRAGQKVKSLAEVEAFVGARVDGPERSDYIMAVCDLPDLDESLLAALVDAAHRRGKPAVGQATDVRGFERALHAGFDMITHVPLDALLSRELAAAAAARKVICIPTLCELRRFMQRVQREEEEREEEGEGGEEGALSIH